MHVMSKFTPDYSTHALPLDSLRIKLLFRDKASKKIIYNAYIFHPVRYPGTKYPRLEVEGLG